MDNFEIYTYLKARKNGGSSADSAALDALIDRSLTSISDNRVASIGTSTFNGCTSLVSVVFPNVVSAKNGAFSGCTSLTSVDLPLLTTVNGNAFNGCTSLTNIDLKSVTAIYARAFVGCTNLAILILRANQVCVLSDANAFNNTPIANGTGYIYVPDNIVNDYKVATNWAVYEEQIKRLSQLPEGV